MRTGFERKVAKNGINKQTIRYRSKVDTDCRLLRNYTHLPRVILRVDIHDGPVGGDVAGHFPAQGVDDVAGVRDCHGGLAGLPIDGADHGGSDDEGQ